MCRGNLSVLYGAGVHIMNFKFIDIDPKLPGGGGEPFPSSTYLTRVTLRDHMILQVFTSKYSLNSVILLTIIHYILEAIKRGALSYWG